MSWWVLVSATTVCLGSHSLVLAGPAGHLVSLALVGPTDIVNSALL